MVSGPVCLTECCSCSLLFKWGNANRSCSYAAAYAAAGSNRPAEADRAACQRDSGATGRGDRNAYQGDTAYSRLQGPVHKSPTG
jgi:hypothetical protein